VELLDSWQGLRAGVRITRRCGATTIVQTLTLDAGAGRLEVRTEVDWQERQMLLRALFPFSPNASHATLGRQFGSLEVPVHRNTSWEQARFEVAAHGWLDVGDGGGGVALLTDALYGHSAVQRTGTGVEVGVSLLKSGAWPDPQADRGAHVLRYAVAPHAGSWQQAGIPRQALELAVPLRVRLGAAAAPRSLLSLDGLDADHVIAETAKTAWDGDGLVVRLFEAHNRCGTVTLRLDRPIRTATLATLDEADLTPLDVTGDTVTLAVRPHQLATVRLRF
jgi:alpha-mannosidase